MCLYSFTFLHSFAKTNKDCDAVSYGREKLKRFLEKRDGGGPWPITIIMPKELSIPAKEMNEQGHSVNR
jgi:hypothetical protein